jgi:uncharacterized protein (DUF983 family)
MSALASNAPAELNLGRAARLFWRALRLRCPNCGGDSLFLSFGRLRPDCPTCGLQLDRGESDYFLGAYLFNLVVVELLFAALLGIVMVATWPSPPWELLQWGGAALMVAGAVFCYPFAKTLWLAFDVMLRPVERDELPSPLPERGSGR